MIAFDDLSVESPATVVVDEVELTTAVAADADKEVVYVNGDAGEEQRGVWAVTFDGQLVETDDPLVFGPEEGDIYGLDVHEDGYLFVFARDEEDVLTIGKFDIDELEESPGAGRRDAVADVALSEDAGAIQPGDIHVRGNRVYASVAVETEIQVGA